MTSEDDQPTTTRSPHPPHCRACEGCGWVEGPPRYHTANGHPITYTTVTPCTWDWWNDEPTLDEPLATDDPRALAAFARGVVQGMTDLATLRPPPATLNPPTEGGAP